MVLVSRKKGTRKEIFLSSCHGATIPVSILSANDISPSYVHSANDWFSRASPTEKLHESSTDVVAVR